MNYKISIITQARTGSQRLPSKVLKNVGNYNMLQIHLKRVLKSTLATDFIVATTLNKSDDIISEIAVKEGFQVFRGSENDVLDRYYQAAKEFKSDIIVRVTSDCPLVDPIMIDDLILAHISNKKDFTSNITHRTFPDGMDIEIFDFNILEKAWQKAQSLEDREHVTFYIWKNCDLFSQYEFTNKVNYSNFRLTLDYIEDYELLENLINLIGYEKRWYEYVDLLISNKQLRSINKKHIN